MLQEYGNKDVVVSSDGRCDSPGKCAKFCTYTLMDASTNTILHTETVDKTEVQNKSPNMEREAVDRALRYLKGQVKVVEITTDSSTVLQRCFVCYIIFISVILII